MVKTLGYVLGVLNVACMIANVTLAVLTFPAPLSSVYALVAVGCVIGVGASLLIIAEG